MRNYLIVFFVILLLSFLRSLKLMKIEKERLRLKLGIEESDPSNKELMEFVFYDWFRFYMILFVIILTGVMICMIK